MTSSKKLAVPILFFLGTFIFLILFFLPFQKAEKFESGSTRYGFPANPFGDYYHYTYFLKSGLEGRINFENVYTDVSQTHSLQFLEPHYNLFGYIMRPFHFSPVELFYLLRILVIPLFILMLSIMINMSIGPLWGKLLALILVLFSTNLWWTNMQEVDVWSNMFNIFRRSAMLPPHYWITVCLFMVIFFHFRHAKKSVLHYITTSALAFNIGIMHPYLGVFLGCILAAELALRSIIEKKISPTILIHLVTYAVSIIPPLWFYNSMLNIYWQSKALANVAAPHVVSLTSYMLSVGSLLPFSIGTLFFFKELKNPVIRYLIVWTGIPFILYFLPYIGIPMSEFRLFQTFQQIPVAILTALVIVRVASRFHFRVQYSIGILIGILAVAYAIPSYQRHFEAFTNPYHIYFIHRNNIESMQPILTFLNTYTPAHAVIVAPDSISSMIPSFSHANVIIGQEGVNPHWYENKPIIDELYAQTLPEETMVQFLKEKNVSYILFGIEAPRFSDTRYITFPNFKEIYKNGNISIVKYDSTL